MVNEKDINMISVCSCDAVSIDRQGEFFNRRKSDRPGCGPNKVFGLPAGLIFEAAFWVSSAYLMIAWVYH